MWIVGHLLSKCAWSSTSPVWHLVQILRSGGSFALLWFPLQGSVFVLALKMSDAWLLESVSKYFSLFIGCHSSSLLVFRNCIFDFLADEVFSLFLKSSSSFLTIAVFLSDSSSVVPASSRILFVISLKPPGISAFMMILVVSEPFLLIRFLALILSIFRVVSRSMSPVSM